jgi:hypothetical protein
MYARLQEMEESRSSRCGKMARISGSGSRHRSAERRETHPGHPASAPSSAVGRRRRPASMLCCGGDELDENEGTFMGIMKETSV